MASEVLMISYLDESRVFYTSRDPISIGKVKYRLAVSEASVIEMLGCRGR